MAIQDALSAARRAGLADPLQVAALSAAAARWGPTLAAPYAAAALRHPGRPAVVDERGALTYARLDARSTALARGLLASGLRSGDHLGLLCTNHRDFVEANVAAAKAGLVAVYLNTGFAPPQLAEVMAREGVRGVVCDLELLVTVEDAGFDGLVVTAGGGVPGVAPLHEVRARAWRHLRLLASRPAPPVLLTSGTTGTPKGARRGTATTGPDGATGLLQMVPYRRGDVVCIPAPLFHAWGLSQSLIAAVLGSTAVLIRRFDPDATLRAVAEHRATVLAVVPVMLQRMLSSGAVDRHDLSSLRIVASSGAALPGLVATEWMDRAGDNLYNLYGSTEVGQATIATPADLRARPGTAGRVVPGTTVAILDEHGHRLPDGTEGRIYVDSGAQFSGYTGGGTKDRVGTLMSTGDVGHFDTDGRLFVTGRSDDMIVSGGENVFPREVEDLLLAHPAVLDAAVVGVDDADFGQRLAAYIVAMPKSGLSARDVRSTVGAHLARHKVPRDVVFVDELPRTTTGKLLRRDLRGAH